MTFPTEWKNKIHVSNHQPENDVTWMIWGSPDFRKPPSHLHFRMAMGKHREIDDSSMGWDGMGNTIFMLSLSSTFPNTLGIFSATQNLKDDDPNTSLTASSWVWLQVINRTPRITCFKPHLFRNMFSHAPFTIHEHHFIPRSGCAGQTWQKSAQTFQFAEVSRPEVASKHSNVVPCSIPKNLRV